MSDIINKLAKQYVDLAYAESEINSYMVDGEWFNTPTTQLVDDPNNDGTAVANPYYKIGIVFDVGGRCDKAEDRVVRAEKDLEVKGKLLTRYMASEGIVNIDGVEPTNPQLHKLQISKAEWESAIARRDFWYQVWFLTYGIQWSDFDYKGAIDDYNTAKSSKGVLDQSNFDNIGKPKLQTK
jgi:hypothetical protein